jgi:hypothetical protein
MAKPGYCSHPMGRSMSDAGAKRPFMSGGPSRIANPSCFHAAARNGTNEHVNGRLVP